MSSAAMAGAGTAEDGSTVEPVHVRDRSFDWDADDRYNISLGSWPDMQAAIQSSVAAGADAAGAADDDGGSVDNGSGDEGDEAKPGGKRARPGGPAVKSEEEKAKARFLKLVRVHPPGLMRRSAGL